MGIGPFELGVSGLIVAGVLAVLVAAVVVTILVLLMWTIALTVVAPAMGGAAVEARHSQLRAWLKQVRESWRAAPPEEIVEDEREVPPPHRREVRGVGVVGARDAGAQTQMLAAHVAPLDAAGSRLDPMAIMRVTLKPDNQLVLPPHPHCNIAVYVLSGRGCVGAHRRPVRGGQVALHGRRTAIRVNAASAEQVGRPLELLVVPQWKGEQALLTDEPLVRPINAAVRHHLRVLQILTEDLPVPEEPFVPAQGAAAEQPTTQQTPEPTPGQAPAQSPVEQPPVGQPSQPLSPAVPAA
jgi:mannose-6-phosphate isomerase-like protein (cupin superfamily)